MKILIIIPAYNEELSILSTINDIKTNSKNTDYLVINDCSTDNTEDILISNNINHVTLPVNLGINGAVSTGYKYAYDNGYDCAVQFDGDGQHPASSIQSLIKTIEDGANIAIGSRYVDKKKKLSLRNIGSTIISIVILLKTGKMIKDPTSGMRMIDRKNLYDYAYVNTTGPEPNSLVKQMKKDNVVKEIQVDMTDRASGKSTYSNIWNSFKYMVIQIITIIFLT